jgi:hypothetical protein
VTSRPLNCTLHEATTGLQYFFLMLLWKTVEVIVRC